MKQAYKRFFSFLFITALSFAIATTAFAQTEGTEVPPEAAPVSEPIPTSEPAPVEPVKTEESPVVTIPDEAETRAETDSEEAREDETVTEEDLDVDEAYILPDNPLYTLKRIGRELRRVFIFNDAKKVEWEIRDANQELVDLNRLLDEKGEEASDVVLRGFERMEERFDSIAERAPDLALEGEEARREVMEQLLDSEIKRQKLFEHMEETADDERVLERAQEVREHMMERIGDMVEGVEIDPQLFDRILQNQEGSQFKDLRNLEILKRLEEKLPQEAFEGIKRAEENAFKRLREQVGQFKNEESQERFEKYMEDFGGDEVIRYGILDRFENTIDEQNIPEEARERIKRARDLSARNFEDRFEGMEERVQDKDRLERMREHMMGRFKVEEDKEQEFEMEFVNDVSERMELISKFKTNFQSSELREEMRKTEEQEIDKFVEAFPDAREDAEQAKQTMMELRKAGEEGDFAKIKLLEKVMKDLEGKQMQDPSKRAFMEQIGQARREAERGFVDHLRGNGEDALKGLTSDDPQQIEFLRTLKEKFIANPDEFGGERFDPGVFDRAMKEQSEHMADEKLRRMEGESRGVEKDLRTFVDEQREKIEKRNMDTEDSREFAPMIRPGERVWKEQPRQIQPVDAIQPPSGFDSGKMEFRFKEERDGERFEFRSEIKDGEEKIREEFKDDLRREEFKREFKEDFNDKFKEEKREEKIKEEFREEFGDNTRKEEFKKEELKDERREEFKEKFENRESDVRDQDRPREEQEPAPESKPHNDAPLSGE